MSSKDGGPAFPHAGYDFFGMSLRDYFAGHALAGLLAKDTQGTFSKQRGVATAVVYAYEYADAMLFERDRSSRPSASEPR